MKQKSPSGGTFGVHSVTNYIAQICITKSLASPPVHGCMRGVAGYRCIVSPYLCPDKGGEICQSWLLSVFPIRSSVIQTSTTVSSYYCFQMSMWKFKHNFGQPLTRLLLQILRCVSSAKEYLKRRNKEKQKIIRTVN